MPLMHICRTKFKKEIVTEFVPPANRRSNKVMIFCSGVPGSPSKDEVLEFYARKGFWTFFPRYRGSWESGGEFLKHSLERDLLDVIDALKYSFKDIWSKKSYRVDARHVTVVGTSFSGPAAILATRDPRVQKAVCISPVVDWNEENRSDPLDDLYGILKEGYGHAYRISKRDWDRLKTGRFYNPVNYLQEIDGKCILIFHAKDDDIVKYGPVARFAKKTGCRLVSFKKGGHLSSGLLTQHRHYWRLRRFLQS